MTLITMIINFNFLDDIFKYPHPVTTYFSHHFSPYESTNCNAHQTSITDKLRDNSILTFQKEVYTLTFTHQLQRDISKFPSPVACRNMFLEGLDVLPLETTLVADQTAQHFSHIVQMTLHGYLVIQVLE